MYHFGISVSEDEKLTKENYMNYYDPSRQDFSLEEVTDNFDKNMAYYNRLSEEDFKNELIKFFKRYKEFKEIFDLKGCNYEGFYLMVLDQYKQVYIGVTDNIKKRILQHWRKSPYAMVIRDKNKSKLCIDSFKALDTTRIFIYTSNEYEQIKNLINNSTQDKNANKIKHTSKLMEDKEIKMIKYLDNKFTCNRRLVLELLYRDL